MASGNLRAIAALVTADVIDDGASLDDALAARRGALSPANHALLQEIAYGSVRWYLLLEAWLAQLVRKPFKPHDRMLHFLLISALYQLEWMRTPDHVVVDETVKATANLGRPWARSVVNGVLRNFLRRQEAIQAAVTDPAARHAFPKWLYRRIETTWPRQYPAILEASNGRPPMTLRVNLSRVSREEYLTQLAAAGIAAAPTVDSAAGAVLKRPRPVTEIPGFAEGLVSVQDESAQLAAPALDLAPGMRVLDACAAPGGKACHLLETEPALDELVAVDLPARVDAIEENLQRLGLEAQVITADSTRPETWWDGRPFQRILLDAPCTGSGVIRRHPDIRHRRRDTDVEKFAAQQLALLKALWPLLAHGGKLLYITCSILAEENEAVARAFTGNTPGAQHLDLAATYGVTREYGRQRLPGEHHGDGFYFCLMEKA
ncbi:MAG: 16S rRNA (cytosine(967)-C(5))-methyltransferase RsmB [Pseudomonadota bacterium]|nr:16S rRNA (cytosine(967)-C(5))-methyltransferase RsmB [Pseudomonadota bacterium]